MNHSEIGCPVARTVVNCFLSALLATPLLPAIASAGDLENSTGRSVVTQPESASRWTAFIGAVILERTGGENRTLVERVEGSTPFYLTADTSGSEAFNSGQFKQGFSGGLEINLIYHGSSGYSAELLCFNVFNQSDIKAIGPDDPVNWFVMKAPGSFWQTQDFPYQAMAWGAATNFYSAEVNRRLELSGRVTVLAGFRWLQLNDNLQGTLTPADLTAPTWKAAHYDWTLFDVIPGDTPAGNYPPFWNTSTVNNLYGFQAGVDGKILEFDRFSLEGLIKVGLFNNSAVQSTDVSMRKVVYPSKASTNHAAFVSETGLQLKYQVTHGLALKAGYKLLWLDGIALAPGQIEETTTSPSSVDALGVNCGSSVLFHGVTAGLEYHF